MRLSSDLGPPARYAEVDEIGTRLSFSYFLLMHDLNEFPPAQTRGQGVQIGLSRFRTTLPSGICALDFRTSLVLLP